MPSWPKGIAKKGGKIEESAFDPFGDVGYYSSGNGSLDFSTRTSSTREKYNDGIAPVVIQIDDTDEQSEVDALQQQHNQQHIQQQQYGCTESSVDNSSKGGVGNGDLIGKQNDLEFCCVRDSCMGVVDHCVGNGGGREGGEAQTVESSTFATTTGARYATMGGDSNSNQASFDSEDDECIGKIYSIDPGDSSRDSETTGTLFSHHLDTIRSMGPIRDKRARGPQKGRRRSFAKNRLCVAIGLACLLMMITIGVIVAVVVKRKKGGVGNSISKAESSQMNDARKDKLKSLLELNDSKSDWETVGSPQNMALDWIANEDPAALSAESTELTERFAAATLYFATGGPQTWSDSLGFLSGDSICEWNNGRNLESGGIFCGKSRRVDELKIVNNNLTGNMPKELNYFSELMTLNLYFNKLTGTIPDLSGLIAIEQIDLDGNELTGTVPESIFNMPNIVNLFLLNNKDLTGTIPEILDSSKIAAISIFGCSFVGTIPQSLTSVSTLRLLQLKDNAIEGTIPPELFSLPSLETLGLDGNRFVGKIPRIQLTENGSALTSLSIGSNSLEGALPDSIEKLTSLQFLYADDNMLTGSIPRAIFELPSLEQLWLHENKLSGDISDLSFTSSSIGDVYLGQNNFSGNLQDLFSSAPSSIQRLDVSGNSLFKGYISDDIGSFDSLKYFNASSCSLIGTLPKETFHRLTEVSTFAVADNQLQGGIPFTMGYMSNLKYLDLSKNSFTGEVPDTMAGLVSLASFDVSGNQDLRGDMGSTFCQAVVGSDYNLVFAAADCTGSDADAVRVECDCCTDCCNREGQCGPNNN
mmetsp:Transcript_11467/g.22658  ORF Transcript_11467/g.22658 Transcript_11467/m.22658 type:complete len:812 (+) Transcript_11467:202-2637(+)|eukprot:CAMPEP_0168169518 /NCGR_PEP_ID=MMETSP0139_2-20121125/3683_1 /TAXON_ID=44445 /ORGANISM="Pseudo-nitzschia australis, Strain 10249 10 AB" /LENGTH=811 /DNA_ID=CAMNT_0008086947 /DNA_START=105 /DNA_END=2540 /DNA_ORIENTATION=-